MLPPPATRRARESYARNPQFALRQAWWLLIIGFFMMSMTGLVLVRGGFRLAPIILVLVCIVLASLIYGAWNLLYYGPRRRDPR